MTLVATLFGYVIGLPLGVILTITDVDGITPNAVIYKILDVIVNLLRSIPFLILLILVIPLTRFLVGKSYGSTATIVPLVIAAAPFIARVVESSLKEVDKGVIEAATSMGAGTWTIITKVLLAEAKTSLLVGVTIVLGTILGYSAMAGAHARGRWFSMRRHGRAQLRLPRRSSFLQAAFRFTFGCAARRGPDRRQRESEPHV